MNDRNEDVAADEDEDMLSGLGVAERELLLRELHRLPDTPPPRQVWHRVREQAAAEGLLDSAPRVPGRLRLLAGAGLAAAVVLAVLRFPAEAPQQSLPETFPTEPAYVADSGPSALEALRVRSEVLENDLRALPAKPSVMRAGTAATISDLEGRIAAIDTILNDSQAGLTPEQTEMYWRERVRLMDSLVALRYAQARRRSM